MSVTTLSPEAQASREAPKVTDQLGKFVISTFAVGCAAIAMIRKYLPPTAFW